MNRPILKTISPGTTPITRSIDDFIFNITDQARAVVDPTKLDFLSRTMSTAMQDTAPKVFTLGGLGIGKVVDENAISRRSATTVSSAAEFLEKVGSDFTRGRGRGSNMNMAGIRANKNLEGAASLLGENPTSLRFGEIKDFIGINASVMNEDKMYKSSQVMFHERGHTATKISELHPAFGGPMREELQYVNPSNSTMTDQDRYISKMVNHSLEESRAETYSYHKIFQSDEISKIGENEAIFKNTGYYKPFGTGGPDGLENPFHFVYGQKQIEDIKGNLKPGEFFDEMDTIIKGEIHANAALVSTVGFGKGDQTQLPFLEKHTADVRASILEKHGEKYALEYDEALQKYGQHGRLGLSSDAKNISEAAAETARKQAAYEARLAADVLENGGASSFSIDNKPEKISARIASKEMPQTIEEGVGVATRRSGATRGLLAASTEASSHVASGTGGSRMLRTAGAALSILRKRF
jgi:hypothetical protein